MTTRSIGYHCDRNFQLFLNEFNVFTAVFRKIFVVFDSTNVFFPSRKNFVNRFCLLKKMCYREFCSNLSVDLITNTYRNLIQISKYIEYCKCYICCSLHSAAIFGCNTVKPSHSSWTSCCSAELSAVTTTSSKLVCFLSKDLAYESSGSYCT